MVRCSIRDKEISNPSEDRPFFQLPASFGWATWCDLSVKEHRLILGAENDIASQGHLFWDAAPDSMVYILSPSGDASNAKTFHAVSSWLFAKKPFCCQDLCQKNGWKFYPTSKFDSLHIGPNMHHVNAGLIRPYTQAPDDMYGIRGLSFAVMKNSVTAGLNCDLFISHAWDEGGSVRCTSFSFALKQNLKDDVKKTLVVTTVFRL